MTVNMKEMWEQLGIYVANQDIFDQLRSGRIIGQVLYGDEPFASYHAFSYEERDDAPQYFEFDFVSGWWSRTKQEKEMLRSFRRNQFLLSPYVTNQQAREELPKGIEAIQKIITVHEMLSAKNLLAHERNWSDIETRAKKALEPYPHLVESWRHVIECALYDF